MSYCRSGDDSNVYVFGNGREIEIHVQASEKIDESIRLDPNNPSAYLNNWRDFPHELRSRSYFCRTEQECLDKLLELRAVGLLVPERALERLRKEIND